MITVELRDAPEVNLLLQPEDRVEKSSGSGQDRQSLSGLISVASPVTQRFTAEQAGDDPVLGRFLTDEADFTFHLVHLACTFRPEPGEPFQAVWVQLGLEREDGVDNPAAIAWSMSPERLEDETEYARSVKLGSDLKFLQGVGSAGVSVGTEMKRTRQEIYLEAFGLLQPDPAWEFTRTARREIRGSHRLLVVVRAPHQAAVRGNVQLSATVQRKRFGLLAYTAVLPDSAPLGFTL